MEVVLYEGVKGCVAGMAIIISQKLILRYTGNMLRIVILLITPTVESETIHFTSISNKQCRYLLDYTSGAREVLSK